MMLLTGFDNEWNRDYDDNAAAVVVVVVMMKEIMESPSIRQSKRTANKFCEAFFREMILSPRFSV